jgi:NADH:ubiquinone oxidoreductase subunit
MTIGTKLFTAICGKKVGEDEFGNRYFTSKKGRRWVMYNGIAEASKVPAIWHRWLHKTTDEVPTGNAPKHDWQKTHTPNLTGTTGAYAPKGHIKSGGKRAKATGDYTAWKPE